MKYKKLLSQRPYVEHARCSGKDSNITIVRKRTTTGNDKHHHLPYYVSRIQLRQSYVKLKWINQYFPDHEVIVELENPNSIHALNRFEEECYVEQR